MDNNPWGNYDVESSQGCSWGGRRWSWSGMSAAKSSVRSFDVTAKAANNGNQNTFTCHHSRWSNLDNLHSAVNPASDFSSISSSTDTGFGESKGFAPKGASAWPAKMQYVKGSYRAATSPAAQRTYLITVLFFAASLALLCIAALAYPVFYYNYVPKKLISIPVHLQYDSGINPYGVTSLSPNLMLEQAYDVSVELTVPRSPTNLQRGNFMVALFAMKSVPDNPAFTFSFSKAMGDLYTHVREDNVVFMSRRPTLIPYMDPFVSMASRFLFLFFHILSPDHAETTTLTVPMGELVEFKDVLPLSFLLDVQAGQSLQVYSATITLVARLTGIRWAMYNHRIISFLACTTVFWVAEMFSAGLAWLLLSLFLSDEKPTTPNNNENDEFQGDILAGQPIAPQRSFRDLLRDSDDEEPRVKKEESDDDGNVKVKKESQEQETLIDQPADDEEDGDGGWKESGAGTSFSHSHGKGGSLRRRSSRGRS